MKVKLGKLMAAGGNPQEPGPLQKLVQVDEFHVGLKYRLAKLAIAVNDALQAFTTTRNALVEKYGTVHKVLDADGKPTDRDEQGKGVRPGDESWPEFAKEFDALTGEEVDLDAEVVILPPEALAEGVTSADLIPLIGLVTIRGEDEKPALKVVE